MIRPLAGLALPETVGEQLHTLTSGIPGAHWVELHTYHIALRFIGRVSEDAAEDLDMALAKGRGTSFAVKVTGLGTFGQGHRIQSLWAGIGHAPPPLLTLRDKVERVLVWAGLAPESRRYAPHITLAHLKGSPTARVQ